MSAAVRYSPSYRFKAKVTMRRAAATLRTPNVRVVDTLGTVRTSYSFNTNMFTDALSQYDAVHRQFNANIRFDLIHHPLSDLFIVCNDQRILTPDAPVAGRGIIVTFKQMMSF